MKKLIFFITLLGFGCESEKIEKKELQCSIQATTLLLPVGNYKTIEINGSYTPEELVEVLKQYDLYLINCVKNRN